MLTNSYRPSLPAPRHRLFAILAAALLCGALAAGTAAALPNNLCPDRSLPRLAHLDLDYNIWGKRFFWSVDYTYAPIRYTNRSAEGTYSDTGTLSQWSECPAPNHYVQVVSNDGQSWSCTHVCLPDGREEIHCPHIQLLYNRLEKDFTCEGNKKSGWTRAACYDCLDAADAIFNNCRQPGQANIECWRERNRKYDECVNDKCGGCDGDDLLCSAGECVGDVCVDQPNGGIQIGQPKNGSGGGNACTISGGAGCPAECFSCTRMMM